MKQITAQFFIEYHQFLDEHSNLIGALPQRFENPEILTGLYRQMVFTRLFDAKAVALQRTGKMGTYPSSLGQEAIFVAIGHVLHKTDILVPYYRDQGALLMRGVKPEQIFAYWGGDERGSLFSSTNTEDFPFSVPIASQCLHAAGVAYAIKLRKQARAVLVTCGDGGTSEGDFYEAMNFAATFRLPIVFVVSNNQWAISVSRQHQTACETLAQKAISAGFKGVQVDGNDVIAVAEVVSHALDKAKSGDGPTLIEAITYRLCDHTTADDAKRYSPAEDLAQAWKIEPLARLRKYLVSQQLWSAEEEQQLEKNYSDQIMQSVENYLNIEPQLPTSLLAHMYETWPAAWQDQWDALATLQQREEG